MGSEDRLEQGYLSFTSHLRLHDMDSDILPLTIQDDDTRITKFVF